ncbi:hypothetical protein LDENG_00083880 [Lucifuga dentata]|nr:hypothetical protein LDENG_00083880 [Lucifuga dentata]
MEREWHQFDEDVDGILEATAKVDQLVTAHHDEQSSSTSQLKSLALRSSMWQETQSRLAQKDSQKEGQEACSLHCKPLWFHQAAASAETQQLTSTSTTPTVTAREQELGECKVLITLPDPTTKFNIKEPTLKEVQEVLKAARTNSAPGPSGVLHKVYN